MALSLISAHSYSFITHHNFLPIHTYLCTKIQILKFLLIYNTNNSILIAIFKPRWRNGRRSRLKICRWQHHEGSIPSLGTIFLIAGLPAFFVFTEVVFRELIVLRAASSKFGLEFRSLSPYKIESNK